MSREARRERADATVAVVVSPRTSAWRASPTSAAIQSSLATTVVVLDATDLPGVAGATSPRDAFVEILLGQADLMRPTPSIYNGATPPEMFFGREEEVATIRSAISASSIALLGGRRIGKTSLMHRAIDALRSDGWEPFYADCQECGSWETFVSLIEPRWKVALPRTFKPSHVASLVAQLQSRASGRVVLLLDEIDELLRWDQIHEDGNVSEAFFRACRALSQEGAARFVFSGERVISERLWDPKSPHWNFCRALFVQQLTREAANDLLRRPFTELRVSLLDANAFLGGAWRATDGHPRLLQYLGDRLVAALNSRPAADRTYLSADDVAQVSDSRELRQEYVVTYLGQSTPDERALVGLIASGVDSSRELRAATAKFGLSLESDRLQAALRMLHLYGVIRDFDEPYRLRAEGLPTAFDSPEELAAFTQDSATRARALEEEL